MQLGLYVYARPEYHVGTTLARLLECVTQHFGLDLLVTTSPWGGLLRRHPGPGWGACNWNDISTLGQGVSPLVSITFDPSCECQRQILVLLREKRGTRRSLGSCLCQLSYLVIGSADGPAGEVWTEEWSLGSTKENLNGGDGNRAFMWWKTEELCGFLKRSGSSVESGLNNLNWSNEILLKGKHLRKRTVLLIKLNL